jgi:hypothetical protein
MEINRDFLIDTGWDWSDVSPGWVLFFEATGDVTRWLRWDAGKVYVGNTGDAEPWDDPQPDTLLCEGVTDQEALAALVEKMTRETAG